MGNMKTHAQQMITYFFIAITFSVTYELFVAVDWSNKNCELIGESKKTLVKRLLSFKIAEEI